jgi:hypothetical protein
VYADLPPLQLGQPPPVALEHLDESRGADSPELRAHLLTLRAGTSRHPRTANCAHPRTRYQRFLDETLDTDHIEADSSGGVLALQIPIHESAKPRKVSVTRADSTQQITA